LTLATSGWAFQTALRTLAQEARGEPLEGQQAVAAVLVNRVKDGRWGGSLASVCLWPWQFSGWARTKDPNFTWGTEELDNSPVLAMLNPVLVEAVTGRDPTGGALYYYNPTGASPHWAKQFKLLGHHGRQLFFTDRVDGRVLG